MAFMASRPTSRAWHPGRLRASLNTPVFSSSRLAIRAPRSAIWSSFSVQPLCSGDLTPPEQSMDGRDDSDGLHPPARRWSGHALTPGASGPSR